MSNELEGRRWFIKQVRRVLIATIIVAVLSVNESFVQLITGWFGL